MRGAIVAIALVTIVAIFLWPTAPSGDVHEVQLLITAPDGEVLFNGTSQGATVYDALTHAAERQGLSWHHVGAGCSLYVDEIAGYEGEGRSGWTFTVNGEWAVASAGCISTTEGMHISWFWSTV